MGQCYIPFSKLGDRVKAKQSENTFTLPAGLNDGDEVTVVGGWDHASYTVEKDGKRFRLACQCLDIPCLP